MLNAILEQQVTRHFGDTVPEAMLPFLQDISKSIDELQFAEQQRAENEHRLFENMRDVFFSVDMRRHVLLHVSNACEVVYGYKASDFAGNPDLWYDVILEEDRGVIQQDEALLRNGEAVMHQYRITHKNGEQRWLESKITPTLNNGVLARIDGMVSDITARKETEAALTKSEHKLRSLVQHSSDAIIVLNEKMEAVFASDSLYRITGYTPEEVMNISPLTFMHPDDLPKMQALSQNLIINPGKAYNEIYRRIKKDGSIMWCEGTAVNLLADPSVKGNKPTHHPVS